MVVPAFALGPPELVVLAVVALFVFLPVVALSSLGYLAFVHTSDRDHEAEDRLEALQEEVAYLRERVAATEDDEETRP